MKLFVCNINYETTESELRAIFEEIGPVKSVRIVQGRGFGFAEFVEPLDAARALDDLSGRMIKGRKIKIYEARGEGRKENR